MYNGITADGCSRRLDGNTSLLFVFTCVCKSRLSRSLGGNDANLTDKGIGECRLAVIHVSDHTHVADVSPLVHDLTDLY